VSKLSLICGQLKMVLNLNFWINYSGHCKHVKPQYATIARHAAAFNPPLKFAKADITANDELAKKFEI